MSIKQLCELLKTHEHENTRTANELAREVTKCSQAEIDLLLECLHTNKAWKIHAVLTALKWAQTDHARVVTAVKPLLRHEDSLVCESTLELLGKFGEHAREAGPAVVDVTDALLEARKTIEPATRTACVALKALGTIPANSQSVMLLLRKINWTLPKEFAREFRSDLLSGGLVALSGHWEADAEFAETTLLSLGNSKWLSRLSLEAYEIMLQMTPRRPAMLWHFLQALLRSSPTAEKYAGTEFLLDLLLQSTVDPKVITEALLNPDVPLVRQDYYDHLPKGYEFIRSKQNFPRCRPVLEAALCGSDFESFNRAVCFLQLAGSRWPEVATIVANEARQCDSSKLGLLLDVLLDLDAPVDEVRTILKRANDNKWSSPDLDSVTLRIHELSTLKSFVSEGWQLLWSIQLPDETTSESLVLPIGRVCVNYRHVLEPKNDKTWETNRETFGIYMFDDSGTDVILIDMPLGIEFPKQRTGGDITRQWFAQCVVGDRGLAFLLKDPFADKTGWGERTFAYMASLDDGKWARLRGENTPIEMVTPGTLGERIEHAVGFGDVIVWPTPEGSFGIYDDQATSRGDPKEPKRAAELKKRRIESAKLGHVAAIEPIRRSDFRVKVDDPKAPALEVHQFEALMRKISGRRWDKFEITSAGWANKDKLALLITASGAASEKSIKRSFVLLFGRE